MPKLPIGATPSRTCPDRYNCRELTKEEKGDRHIKCPYLADAANERPTIQAECLAKSALGSVRKE